MMQVIGLAGTDEKVEWLKEIGFDVAHNYKEVDVGAAIKADINNYTIKSVGCKIIATKGTFLYSLMRILKKYFLFKMFPKILVVQLPFFFLKPPKLY